MGMLHSRHSRPYSHCRHLRQMAHPYRAVVADPDDGRFHQSAGRHLRRRNDGSLPCPHPPRTLIPHRGKLSEGFMT